MKKRVSALILAAFVLAMALSGCGKENKYVNVGVEMSTAGMSLYLTNTANELQKISTYVFFSESPEATIDKIRRDKQGIDIAYLPAENLNLIKEGSNLTIVFTDCFEEDGSLRGVWIARDGWLQEAPNYSKKYIMGLVKSADYRAAHLTMGYDDAMKSIEGLRDFDWEVLTETMQYCAVYASSNKETLEDYPFTGKSADEMLKDFTDFSNGSGAGYDCCKAAYAKYSDASTKNFDELFNLSIMIDKLDEFVNGEKTE